ncbi:endonuclease/exonuclease/phosphatase family protein [Kitasatospora sp. NPDC088556]|uniref:endonuclease/exonuclease/phosphatase family protein n=1 Tax=Kitasatospora sp. NPDC088556 TaxID=3364076 RepID=UPI00382EEF8D
MKSRPGTSPRTALVGGSAVRIGELAGHGRPSEDRVITTDHAVIVLDGVSTVTDDQPRGGWYADTLGSAIAQLLNRDPGMDLRQVLATAIGTVADEHALLPGSSPASTVAIVRRRAQRIEAVVLGDSPVVAIGRDGSLHPVRDDRLAVLVNAQPQVREYRDLLRAGHGFGERHRHILKELRDFQSSVVNRPGGYWIAEAVPEAGLNAITASWPTDDLAEVVIATDGISAGIEEYELYSWQELARACREDGPQAVADAIDRAEHDDPAGQLWPRYKAGDDKALAWWPFTGAERVSEQEAADAPDAADLVTIANLNAYKLHPRDVGTEGWKARVTAIREVAPDVLCLQEILVDEDTPEDADENGIVDEAKRHHRWDTQAAAVIERLAHECGLTATTVRSDGSTGAVAMARNSHRPWFTAVLWSPATVTPMPGGFRAYGSPDYWHGCTTIQLDIGAQAPLLIASYHGDPFRPDVRADEARRLKGAFRRTSGARHVLVLGDFNSISAATVTIDGAERLYDAEPYTVQDHDDLEYQCRPETIGDTNLADRRPTAMLLRRGFMVDAAAHLRVPWEPTVGHWEDGEGDPDPWGPRRIDLALATRPVAPALVGYRVHRSPTALAASDHLLVVVDVALSKILP